MPAYVYEIPARNYREDRNWETEAKALSALKHVARRAVASGASKDDVMLLTQAGTTSRIFEGVISEALKAQS
jgi:hypothetical protein